MPLKFSDKVKNMKPSAIREILKSFSDPTGISFAAGNPSPLSFPVEEMKSVADDIFSNNAAAALQYGVTEGYSPLREQIRWRLENRSSIGMPHDDVIITSGGQQAIDLTAKILCNEGDTVICENPSFIGALNAFRSYNTNLVGIDIKDGGIDPDELEAAIKKNPRTKLIYLIPNFQNPAGVTMSLEKRVAVLKIARQYGVHILEDDPYGELRFSGTKVPSIKSMDTDGTVIYTSSFSKILSSGMRVGYCCAHRDIIQKLVVCKQVNDVQTNQFFQMLVSGFIDKYDLDRHISGICSLYGQKCGLMLETMDKTFCGNVSYTRPEGGLFIWVTVPGRDGDELAREALQEKVSVVAGSTFCPEQGAKSSSFRLNYSTPSDEQIVAGITRLSGIINRG